VLARAVAGGSRYSSQSRSAPDGTIKLGRLTEGEHYFIFPRDGMWMDNGGQGSQRFTVKKGQHLEGVKIIHDYNEPEPGSLTISGRVSNVRGEPIGGARVQFGH